MCSRVKCIRGELGGPTPCSVEIRRFALLLKTCVLRLWLSLPSTPLPGVPIPRDPQPPSGGAPDRLLAARHANHIESRHGSMSANFRKKRRSCHSALRSQISCKSPEGASGSGRSGRRRGVWRGRGKFGFGRGACRLVGDPINSSVASSL